MLHHAGEIAVHPLIVVVALHIVVGDMDARGALHLLVDAGERQTAFLGGFHG